MNNFKSTVYVRHLVITTFVFLLVLFFTASASAISIKKVQLSATTLRIEGSQAVNNAAILIDGVVGGNADGGGRYRFDVTGYRSSNCIVQLSDGFTSTSGTLSNCTPASAPLPTAQNSVPVANAGANVTVEDTDANGVEIVTLNGVSSNDPDGTVVGWEWTESGLQIASGVTAALSFSLGIHTLELTVTDNQGATAVDTIIISVVAQLPPPPTALPPLLPDAILESNQVYSGSFDPAQMDWSVDSAGDVNGDGFKDVIVGAKGWDTPGGFLMRAQFLFSLVVPTV